MTVFVFQANENAEKKRGFPFQFEAPMNERGKIATTYIQWSTETQTAYKIRKLSLDSHNSVPFKQHPIIL